MNFWMNKLKIFIKYVTPQSYHDDKFINDNRFEKSLPILTTGNTNKT